MVQYEELRLSLLSHEEKLTQLRTSLGLDKAAQEIEELEKQQAEAGFWDDIQNSQKVVQRTAQLKNKIKAYDDLKAEYEDALTMIELADEEEDLELFDECNDNVVSFVTKLDAMTLSTLLTGEYDSKNAILTFHAGAGGTEAQDWNQMLVRMYEHWAEKHGFKVSLVDFLDGEEAGLKSAVLLIEGENAYGYMKSEMGVHRLVRISPFDASGRRHT
ncbi:MAG: PCRF domain-containing protein, partial [Clostridia bacterium]|nr:PCRF domain-containing protein [Clostridia bacterium]